MWIKMAQLRINGEHVMSDVEIVCFIIESILYSIIIATCLFNQSENSYVYSIQIPYRVPLRILKLI
jgi:hypothetical protein